MGEEWVAVDKPSGWFVHRTDFDPSAAQVLLQWTRRAVGQVVFPVHRLDRATSGVVLFALTPAYARVLASAFAQGTIAKHYRALVRGWPAAPMVIDHALSRTRDDCAPGKTPADYPKVRAVSWMTPIAGYELPLPNDRHPTTRVALIELQPKTGRRHQLRRHMKHISHPIVGDPYYGKGPLNRVMAQRYACARLMLACVSLQWEGHCVSAPCAEDFRLAMAQITASTGA